MPGVSSIMPQNFTMPTAGTQIQRHTNQQHPQPDVTRPLSQDNILGAINPDTPYQEPQKMCNRDTLCLQQGCLLCRTPSTHVRNPGADLNNSNASSTPPTTDELPQPPPNHPIWLLTSAFQPPIQKKDNFLLKCYFNQYTNNFASNTEFLQYNYFDLHASYLTAKNTLDSPIKPDPPTNPWTLLPTQIL